MVRRLTIAVVVWFLALGARAVSLDVTVTVRQLNPDGFVELKAESDEAGEKATGHLTAVGEERAFHWDMGSANQNIWYWWDTLDGKADLKIVVTGAPQVPVTLFQGTCVHDGKGEVQVRRTVTTSSDPHGYTIQRRYTNWAPHIEENSSGAITHVKDADRYVEFPCADSKADSPVASTYCEPVSGPEPRMSPLEAGKAYLQADLYSRPADSAESCSRICLDDPNCRAMTYIISQRLCWIKNAVPASAASSDMISAVKLLN